MNPKQLEKLAQLLLSLKSRVKCSICLDCIEHIVELECSHRFCNNCLAELRLQNTECPLCKQQITRRAPLYKDQFADELSKFTNRVCQLVKEKYAQEVEELCSGKTNLQEVIDTAPKDIPTTSIAILKDLENETEEDTDAFEKLQTRRCYVNKKKHISQVGKAKVLDFTDNDTRTKIINWLNDNQEKLDILTQTPQFFDEDESEFQMPSISQVQPIQKQKYTNKTRSQSLNLGENLTPPLLKRYHSLNEGLNENDDYCIEEVHSEAIVKQLERKVILDMLEDECLQTLDHVAQLDNEKAKVTSSKGQNSLSKTKNTNLNISSSTSGWDRIDNVKKTIEGTAKKPKKLNIKLQSPTAEVKTSSIDNTKKKSPVEKKGNKRKISPKATKAGGNKHKKTREASVAKEESNNKTDQMMDLDIIIDATTKSRNDELPNNKENVSNNVKNHDDDIFYLPTQVTSHSSNQSTICHISPISKEFNNVDNIAIRLSDHLKSCISSASNMHSEFGNRLVECFTNLLTYSEKIVKIRLEKVSTEVQTFQAANDCRKSASVQTDNISKNTVSVQSIVQTANKFVQTFTNLHNVAGQRNDSRRVEKGIQVSPENKLENNAFFNTCIKISVSNNEKIITSAVTSKSNKTLHISDETSKKNTSDKISDKLSQDSILLCTLDPSSKSEEKVNRKLTYQESQARKFKRIRRPASNSESEEVGNPSKKKFVRDDLTVEFIDTQKPINISNNKQKEDSTPDSEPMDYDKYLFEVMKKYDSPPPKKKSIKTNQDTLPNNHLNSAGNKSQKEESYRFTSESKIGQSQLKLQKDIDSDHIFTANNAFEDNLDKFDQEILEYERAATYNTETDLIENTPIAHPTRTISRVSNKVPESIKIISKGSASSKSILNIPVNAMVEGINISILEDREPQVKKNTEDIEDNLTDLCKEDLFKNDLKYNKEQCKTNVSANKSTNLNLSQEQNINVSNIDKVLEDFPDFDDDEEIEEELQKISFTAAQAEVNKRDKICILQNVKVKGHGKIFKESELDKIIEISDVSDEEIVETTPQKKYCSKDRLFLDNFAELENSSKVDVCLPPPPGFGDDEKSSPPPDNQIGPSSPTDENCSLDEDISSVTPDRLSDFILSPEKKALDTEKKESQCSIFFKPPVITPRRPAKDNGDSLRISQIIGDNSENVFSSITKSPVKLTQAKHNPLVLTSRSTKKSNLMTSTPNQKSILNYVVPSQESLPGIPQKPKPCIMWSRILNKDLNVFTQLECRKLLTTSKMFSPQVTHLVVLVDEKGQIVSHTAKILQAIAAGIWVVRYEWAEDCLRMNRIVPEGPYEALDTTGIPGPQISRLSRKVKPLFKDFLFYCAPPFKTVSKRDLESILKLSGGEIARDLGVFLANDGKIPIILTESSATEETDQFDTWLEVYKAVTVDMEWLTICIGQYKLVSFRPFLISGDESRICDLEYPETLVESVPFTLTEAM